ncbi:hypothetical protein TWF718_008444 [Orbilia javanica]|uniref:Uncharacterized protein n=1 Tax=Orbilia javanica TaxID=47235 RepID=A0AAN8MYB9_9PEZI
MDEELESEGDFKKQEAKYLTSCAILTNTSTQFGEQEKEAQLAKISSGRSKISTKDFRQMLAALLVAQGGGDCIAVALGGLTKDKIALLASTSHTEQQGQQGRAYYTKRPMSPEGRSLGI